MSNRKFSFFRRFFVLEFVMTLRLPTVPSKQNRGKRKEVVRLFKNLLLIGGYYFLLPWLIVFPLANEFFPSLVVADVFKLEK